MAERRKKSRSSLYSRSGMFSDSHTISVSCRRDESESIENQKTKSKCNDKYNTTETELQEGIEKNFTPKRHRALSVAHAMRGISGDLALEEMRSVRNGTDEKSGFESYQTADWWHKRAEATADCGSYLEFELQPDLYRLHKANFCKSKFCPMCMWRRSLKIFAQMSQVMDYLQNNPETRGYRYVFLTLTQRNCTGPELPGVVDRMAKAWYAIIHGDVLPGTEKSHRYSWLREHVIRGAFRTLEVTVNQAANTYHPHFHIVLAVPHNYFLASNPWYMSHSDWFTLWRAAMALDYDPSVRIESIKPDPERGYGPAVAEVSKYPVKDSDFMGPDISFDNSKDFLYNLNRGLFNRRLLSWSGCFAQARRALGLTDPENGDITDTETINLRPDVETLIRVYRWRVGIGGVIGGSYQRDKRLESFASASSGGVEVSADDFDG